MKRSLFHLVIFLSLLIAKAGAEQTTGLCFTRGMEVSADIPNEPDQAAFTAQADAIMSGIYKTDQPGAALLVMKDGNIWMRKAYGMADLELGVALEPDMIFRIGSMTKPFTAVAILILAEQGRLALSDPIGKFLPDYPAQGQAVTVEQLLTHTSGIPNYTSFPEWQLLMRKDMTLTELIDVFKYKPREFEPSDRWKYSNSGYILLGAIIERASGLTYEAFLKKNIFDPLGLKHTFYGSVSPIIPGRVRGYEAGSDGTFLNAGYISMTQPYAAGSLLCNIDDLAAWNQALLAGKLIKSETLEKAWTAYKLKDGTSTGYGYGWSIGESFGTRVITNDGDINGFASVGILFPEERLFIALLTNSEAGELRPEPIASRIAALALGKSFIEPKAVSMDPEIFDQYVGEYELAPGFTIRIFRDGTRFMSQGTGEPAFEIFPESETRFFLKAGEGKSEFVKDETGKVIEMVLTVRGRTIKAKRIVK